MYILFMVFYDIYEVKKIIMKKNVVIYLKIIMLNIVCENGVMIKFFKLVIY